MASAPGPGKKLISILAVAILALALAALARIDLFTDTGEVEVQTKVVSLTFHELDRMAPEPPQGLGECNQSQCHHNLPHTRSRKYRAFLNLHELTMDCSTCHIAGSGVRPKRFLPDGSRAEGYTGRIYGSKKSGAAWQPLTGNHDTVKIRPSGPTCRECHRRNSPFLKNSGLYDSYKVRLLQDLAVLPLMEGGN